MTDLYIGIMSGTSLDGADVVLAAFDADHRPRVVATASSPFDDALRSELLGLQRSGTDELHRAAVASNRMVDFHAALVATVCANAGIAASAVTAIGAHGQTVRHRPELGYTVQLNAPARLAEACGIAVVADFRGRDVAAGGQGAPLVPAFHDAIYRSAQRHRVVLNLGGMANVTDLPSAREAAVRGWDCGPGNVLLDGWIRRHRNEAFDADGLWAASGTVSLTLLEALRAEPWFASPPPKSTGRDRFDLDWLDARLAAHRGADRSLSPVDVQATLSALTATTVADAIVAHAGAPDELIVCGGGAHNKDLLRRLASQLAQAGLSTAIVRSSDDAAGGIAPEHVEALAFAWLAMRCLSCEPGNLPAVTGARGLRVLGAIYPR